MLHENILHAQSHCDCRLYTRTEVVWVKQFIKEREITCATIGIFWFRSFIFGSTRLHFLCRQVLVHIIFHCYRLCA